MPWLKALKRATPTFLRFLPIIWITSIAWNILLEYLRSVGVVEATPPQELVQLFSSGGNPYLITCLALAAIFLAPYVEEILFRGCIYRFLKSQTLIPFAQFISGIIFAAIHGNLASFGPLIVVGILLAHIYEKEGSLRVSIFFHALFNAFSLVLILLASHSEVIPVT
jgi:membrane protease YdiL (CAAX protease family)